MSCLSFRVCERTKFLILGADNSGNKLVNESPRSALRITVWVAIGLDGTLGSCFVEMMIAEQSQLSRSTIVKCLKSSTSPN